MRGYAPGGIDLHGGGHAGHQPDTCRHLIDVDSHRHALR
jgi:hypothetical protein